jgi:hypothetical protein
MNKKVDDVNKAYLEYHQQQSNSPIQKRRNLSSNVYQSLFIPKQIPSLPLIQSNPIFHPSFPPAVVFPTVSGQNPPIVVLNQETEKSPRSPQVDVNMQLQEVYLFV